MADEVKYECVVCDERGFKSRGEWLFHLVLKRHNLKALEKMEELYVEYKAKMLVITDIGRLDNPSILEYVSGKMPSFSNFVSFKPGADVCAVYCSSLRDFGKFAAALHVIDGVQPRVRDYLEIPSAEWRSYINRTDINEGENGSPSVSTTSSRTGKRTGNHSNLGSSSTRRKVPRLESARKPTISRSWAEEYAELEDFIMIPEAGRKARTTAITELKTLLKPTYPNCELINVGFDFLGFDLEKGRLKLYFDATGITNPDNDMGPVRNIPETDEVVWSTITRVYNKLKRAERGSEAVKEVKCNWGGDSLKFVYNTLYDDVPLNVTLMFKPFKLAQTALLCKQLYFSSFESMSLVKMVVFWAMKNGFAEEEGQVSSSFTIYWLVYFYLMQEKGMKPVIELQKSCNYQLIDEELNVAFSYDSSLLYKTATKGPAATTMDGGKSQLQLLLSWFQWTIYTFRNPPQSNGVSRRTSLVCPRFGVLIDKVKFSVFQPGQSLIDVEWEWELTAIGFEVSMWGKLGKLRTLNNLCIQHPLYIDDNVSQDFNKKWNKGFFKLMRKTKKFVTRLVRGELQLTFLETLTNIDDRVLEPKVKAKPYKNKTSGGNDHDSEGDGEDNSEGEGGKPLENSNSTFCEVEDGGNSSLLGLGLGPNSIEALDTTVTLSAVHLSNYQHWASEITHMMSTLTLSDSERCIRTTVTTYLKTMLRSQYRNCEIIPVGADFLGFNIDKENFHMYFDPQGVTNPSNLNSKHTIDECNNATQQLQSSIFKILKSKSQIGARESGPVSLREVNTTEMNKKEKFPTSITFQCIVWTGGLDVGQINCTLFLRPFRFAETALLCKQLFLTNPEARTLLTLIIYWMTQRSDGEELVACFLSNPFVIAWLVHFFLAKKNVLPDAVQLQKSCSYEIIDKNVQNEEMNVAFSFDPSILIEMFSQSSPLVSKDNVKSVVELLVEWFVYMELTGRQQGSATGQNVRKDYVIAPSLYIQHPFYLSNNICQHVQKFQSDALFDAIRMTKVKLTGLVAVAGTQPNVSIREALSS